MQITARFVQIRQEHPNPIYIIEITTGAIKIITEIVLIVIKLAIIINKSKPVLRQYTQHSLFLIFIKILQ